MAAVWRLLIGERPPLVQVVKMGLATTLAWGVVELGIGHQDQGPFFAALAALLTMQPSVQQSLSRATERMAGVVAGVAMALLFARLLGIHTWSVGLLILTSLLLAWALRLGPQGLIQVPISALLIVGIGGTSPAFVYDRIVDTAIGAGIGVALNALVVPPAYVEPVRFTVDAVADATVGLLRRIGSELADAEVAHRAEEWLGLSRGLAALVGGAQAALGRADESLRWNPVRRAQATALDAERRRLTVLTRVSVQVRGVARTLHDHLGSEATLSPEALLILAELVNGTADAVARLTEPVEVADDELAAPGAEGAAFIRAVGELRLLARADPGPMWTVYGALIEDLRRIQGEVRPPVPAGA